MSGPIVDFMQAYFQDQGPKTIAAFIREYGQERVQDFIGGCWAARDLADILSEMVDAGSLNFDGADIMWTELEADLEQGMEDLGLKRTTPKC